GPGGRGRQQLQRVAQAQGREGHRHEHRRLPRRRPAHRGALRADRRLHDPREPLRVARLSRRHVRAAAVRDRGRQLPHLSPVPGGLAGGPDDLPPPRQRRAPAGGHRAPLGRAGQAGVVDTATARAAAARLARFSRTTPSIAIAPPAIVRSGGTSPSRSHAVSSAKTGTRYRNAVTTVTFAFESANAKIVYATAEGST